MGRQFATSRTKLNNSSADRQQAVFTFMQGVSIGNTGSSRTKLQQDSRVTLLNSFGKYRKKNDINIYLCDSRFSNTADVTVQQSVVHPSQLASFGISMHTDDSLYSMVLYRIRMHQDETETKNLTNRLVDQAISTLTVTESLPSLFNGIFG